jgi:hypothetical protein
MEDVMKKILHILFVAVMLSIAPPGESAMTEAQIKAAEAVSKQALTAYVSGVVNEQNYKSFGFESLEESRAARTGSPLPVMIVDLTAVAEFAQDQPLKGSLRDDGRLWYPVLVDDRVRTSLELVLQKDRWIPGAFGGTREIQTLVAVRDKLPELLQQRNVEAPYTVSVVQMPTLLATFLHVESGAGDYLIPAMIQPQRYGLENATVYPAEEVMLGLKDYAARIEKGLIR